MDAFEKVIDFLKENDFAFRQTESNDREQRQIEILNPDSGSHLRVVFGPYEATLFFCDNHEHFDVSYDDEIYWLTDLIEDLLLNRRCAASLFYFKEDGNTQLLATSFASRKDVREASFEKVFEDVMKIERFEKLIRSNGGRIACRFWDPSLNREIALSKQDFSRS
jgi:hypothetical protein